MSSDAFEFLNRLVDEQKINKNDKNDIVECSHESVVTDGNNKICESCGAVLTKEYTFEKEWRYYGSMDTKHNTDPNRCNFRKTDEKTIYKEIEKLNIHTKIVTLANQLYDDVTKSKIYRGNTRKGIIFACVYHAYHLNNNPHSCEQLIQLFEINQKIALKGLKFVNLNLPQDYKMKLNSSIDIRVLIKEVMNQFNANQLQINEVLEIYNNIENRSSLLNRSRPQSVASGVVRFYIMKRNPSFSNEYFKQKIKLSDLTLSRIVKEIEKIEN